MTSRGCLPSSSSSSPSRRPVAARARSRPPRVPAPAPPPRPRPRRPRRCRSAHRKPSAGPRDSAEHRPLFLQIYRAATAHVEAEAAGAAPGSWAAILDADETVSDNSLLHVRACAGRAPSTPRAARPGARAARRRPSPVPPPFSPACARSGGRIAIVTNRTMAECPDYGGRLPRQGARLRCDALQAGRRPERQDPRASRPWRTHVPPWGCPRSRSWPSSRQHPGLPRPEPGDPPAGRRWPSRRSARASSSCPNPMYGSWEMN